MFEVEKQGAIAHLWLNRPEKRNAMDQSYWDRMPGVIAELDGDDSVRAVVLAGRGPCFCAGIDLMSMANDVGETLQGGLAADRRKLFDTIQRFQEAISCVARCRKPIVAAIHGACVGGGLDLASAADIRLASQDAVFSLREARMAIVADVGSLQRLGPIIGQGHLRELAFTAKDINAERAFQMGLVNEVFENEAALFAGAQAWAEEIAGNAPLAVQGAKEVLTEQIEPEIRRGLRFVAAWNASQLASADLMEAMGAFMERRKPDFKGQ